MPCRCDEPDPSKRQIEYKLLAELMLYVEAAVPMRFVHREECHKDLEDIVRRPTTNIHTYLLDCDTAELCRVIDEFSKQQLDTIVYNGRNADARKLADWWDKHLAADATRREKEKTELVKKLEIKKLVVSATAKLRNAGLTSKEVSAILHSKDFKFPVVPTV